MKRETQAKGGHFAVPDDSLRDALLGLATDERDYRRRLAGRSRLVNAATDARVRRDRKRRRRLWVLGPTTAIFTAFGGSVVASASAMPDSPLYGLKRAAEAIRVDLTFDPQQRGQLEAQLANERAREADAMAAKGRPDLAVAAAHDAQTELDAAATDLGPGDGVSWARQSVSSKLDEVAALLAAKGATKAAAAVVGAAVHANGGAAQGPQNGQHGPPVSPGPGTHGQGDHPTPPVSTGRP